MNLRKRIGKWLVKMKYKILNRLGNKYLYESCAKEMCRF